MFRSPSNVLNIWFKNKTEYEYIRPKNLTEYEYEFIGFENFNRIRIGKYLTMKIFEYIRRRQ